MRVQAWVKIQGSEPLPVYKGSELLSWLLVGIMDEHSPEEVLKENILKAISLAGEVDYRKRKLADFVERLHGMESLLEFCCNNILSAEGMPLLFGFSVIVPIGKGDTGYNPERKRISTRHYDKEEL